jgi:hypothetical protein
MDPLLKVVDKGDPFLGLFYFISFTIIIKVPFPKMSLQRPMLPRLLLYLIVSMPLCVCLAGS